MATASVPRTLRTERHAARAGASEQATLCSYPLGCTSLLLDEPEAENLKLRADLMIRIERYVKASGMTQSQAAQELGVTQPRLNQLLKGKIQLFSLDALVNMLAQGGMQVTVSVKKAA